MSDSRSLESLYRCWLQHSFWFLKIRQDSECSIHFGWVLCRCWRWLIYVRYGVFNPFWVSFV